MGTTFQFLPGVRIQEVLLGAPPISGVGTSTAGFVGVVPKDNRTDQTEKVVLITSADDFAAKFIAGVPAIPAVAAHAAIPAGPAGPAVPAVSEKPAVAAVPAATKSTALSRAVAGFFQNGGTAVYVSIVSDDTDSAKVIAGLTLFEKQDDVQIIAVPGNASTDVAKALSDQAEALRDRVAILDGPVTTDPQQDLAPGATERAADSIFAALYFPQINVGADLENDKDVDAISPTGHIAGIYAQTDGARGVHKAPANVSIRGALGTPVKVTDGEQNFLNNHGVNVLRVFSGNVVVNGARTLQANDAQGGAPHDPLFRYINVRRLTNYVEQTLKAGLRFATFEPNNLALRQTITRSVRGFLDGVFRDGALFGATPEEAYYVRFPDAFNRDEDRLAGKLVLEVGLRPAPPAEFIIVRIGLLTQSAAAS
jgi:phage tail sheath protein FI